MYEEIQELKIQEENEIYRILYVLTAMVADYELIMEENIRMMEKLDYIFSKGKLSLDMDAVEPEINLERKIELKNARHPLMDRNLNVPLKRVFPVDDLSITLPAIFHLYSFFTGIHNLPFLKVL